ncbi:hypothetical protein Sjap_022766 [Stephania japonica]|uniref:Cytochrome P450 n=1 Tax=Stephania japonica TaxID=461633 RepID=A0AAP0EYA8_9MAGN
MEWAMSLLLDHPEALDKARNEIDAHLTSTHEKSNGHRRLIQESDFANLPYLHNIIQETLRLHPAAPLLVPHSSSQDCTVGGYHVPRGTVLLANAWAVHRDPQLWVDPTEFRPERFDDERDVKYCLIPFGMGRRKCPGVGLATREMALCLGILIQCFEWGKVGDDPTDMSEGSGLTVTKHKALEATCWPRETMLDAGDQISVVQDSRYLKGKERCWEGVITAFRSSVVMGFPLATNGLFVLYTPSTFSNCTMELIRKGFLRAITGYGLSGVQFQRKRRGFGKGKARIWRVYA